MPDDAKLGLVAGVAAVILGAVVYLPKPPAAPAIAQPEPTPTASVPVTLDPPISSNRAEASGMTASFVRNR